MSQTRRQFLVGSISGLGAALLGVGCERCSSTRESFPLARLGRHRFPDTQIDLVDLLDHYFESASTANVRAIGYVYLEHLDADTPTTLEVLSHPVRQIEDADTVSHATTRLDEAIVADFNRHRFIDLEGWQLTETLCRLTGLGYHVMSV